MITCLARAKARSSLLRPEAAATCLPLLQIVKFPSCLMHRGYSQKRESGDGVFEKARTTAEEFSRQAKEKGERVREEVAEAWEGVKEEATEVVTGDSSKKGKDELKETVEKGYYDKIGKEK